MGGITFTEQITRDPVRLKTQLNTMLTELDDLMKPVNQIQQQVTVISSTLSGATNVGVQNNAGTLVGVEKILQFLSSSSPALTWSLTDDPSNTRVQIQPLLSTSPALAPVVVGTTRALTINGTANRITSSAGAQDLSADRTWAIDIAATYVGQTSITTLGTVTTGVWNGTTIAIANGGTGQTTANAALNALLPSQGGHVGEFLKTDGTNTSWASASGGSPHNLLSATHSDTLTDSVVLGDIIHGNATPKWARLAGNTTTTKKFMAQTGTGVVSAAPVWDTIVDADVPDILTITKISNLTTNGFVKTSGGDGTLSVDTNTYLTGNQTITLSGDVSGSGATAITTTLATVNANVGSFGSATQVGAFTVNGKGLITAASNITITPAVGSLTGRSDLSGTVNQVNLSASGTNALVGGNNITLSLPQDIHVGATPQWTRLGIGAAASATNLLTFTQAASSGATGISAMVLTGGAHTTLTNAEAVDVNFNLARDVQFAGNVTLALQRAMVIQAPTYTSDTATKTITTAATITITGAPTAGTNVAITNPLALYVQSGMTRLSNTDVRGYMLVGDGSGVASQANTLIVRYDQSAHTEISAQNFSTNALAFATCGVESNSSILYMSVFSLNHPLAGVAMLQSDSATELRLDTPGFISCYTSVGGTTSERMRISGTGLLSVSSNSNTMFEMLRLENSGVVAPSSGAMMKFTFSNVEFARIGAINSATPCLFFGVDSAGTERMRLSAGGNLGLGITSWGTSAATVFGIGSGTAPSTSPADMIQMWSADRGATAGKASLHIRTEDGTSHVLGDRVGIGTLSPTTLVEVRQDQNAGTYLTITNATAGASSETKLVLKSDTNTDAGVGVFSSTTTAFGAVVANSLYMYSSNSAGITIMANQATAGIKFATGGNAAKVTILSSGNVEFVGKFSKYNNAVPTSGKVLVGDGTTVVESTPTFPALASATTRKIIVSDGTNWVASTETYAVPSTVGKIMMSDGTNWTAQNPTYYYGGASATGNDTYTGSLTPTPTAYQTGQIYVFKADVANTGAASINFNSLGAKTIVKAVSTTLSNNDILAGMFCLLVYDGTNMVLMNPRAL